MWREGGEGQYGGSVGEGGEGQCGGKVWRSATLPN